MKRISLPKGSTLFAALVLFSAGCTRRALLLEMERPWWRGEQAVWEDILVDAGSPLTLVVSNAPSAAMAVDRLGKTLARAEHLERELWVKCYRLDTAEIIGAWLVSRSPTGVASICYVRPGLLWVSDGRKVYRLKGGGPAEVAFPGGRLKASRRGNRLAAGASVDEAALTIRDGGGRLLDTFPGALIPADFSPDARRLLVIDESGVLSVIDTRTGTMRGLEAGLGTPARVADARFLPDGHNVAALGAREGRLVLLLGTVGAGVDRRLNKVAGLGADVTGAAILGVSAEGARPWVYLLERREGSSAAVRIDPLGGRREALVRFRAKAVAGLLLE